MNTTMIKKLRKALEFNPPKAKEVPDRAHPFVGFIWHEIMKQKVSVSSVAESAGVERATIYKWRDNAGERRPYLLQIECVLMALGYKLKIVKADEE